MANRYTYQFNGSFKPRMFQIEGFVSVGTGGLLNTAVTLLNGATAVSTGTYYAAVPGSTVAGAPTGWVGGFSGTVGLYGAGVKSIARTATGAYTVSLEDDWVRLDSCQIQPCFGTVLGATGLAANVQSHTVGIGNSTTSKNQIYISFTNNGVGVDIAQGGGFFLDIRVRDSLAGSQ